MNIGRVQANVLFDAALSNESLVVLSAGHEMENHIGCGSEELHQRFSRSSTVIGHYAVISTQPRKSQSRSSTSYSSGRLCMIESTYRHNELALQLTLSVLMASTLYSQKYIVTVVLMSRRAADVYQS